MKPCVVDASVVAAAFFQETGAQVARAILAGGGELHAPDLLLAEVANAIWKRHRRGEINEAEARALLADCLRLPIAIAPSGDLVEAALDLALRTNRTAYDCLYLALAVRTKAVRPRRPLRQTVRSGTSSASARPSAARRQSGSSRAERIQRWSAAKPG
ncbi:MAG: type II toxin-antitoxin system VapC family toxin, partial [Planctomycetota bacterium]|nr:type II toxin-antitoxin system VapC family toxin [Planctomycetota bacterium]